MGIIGGTIDAMTRILLPELDAYPEAVRNAALTKMTIGQNMTNMQLRNTLNGERLRAVYQLLENLVYNWDDLAAKVESAEAAIPILLTQLQFLAMNIGPRIIGAADISEAALLLTDAVTPLAMIPGHLGQGLYEALVADIDKGDAKAQALLARVADAATAGFDSHMLLYAVGQLKDGVEAVLNAGAHNDNVPDFMDDTPIVRGINGPAQVTAQTAAPATEAPAPATGTMAPGAAAPATTTGAATVAEKKGQFEQRKKAAAKKFNDKLKERRERQEQVRNSSAFRGPSIVDAAMLRNDRIKTETVAERAAMEGGPQLLSNERGLRLADPTEVRAMGPAEALQQTVTQVAAPYQKRHEKITAKVEKMKENARKMKAFARTGLSQDRIQRELAAVHRAHEKKALGEHLKTTRHNMLGHLLGVLGGHATGTAADAAEAATKGGGAARRLRRRLQRSTRRFLQSGGAARTRRRYGGGELAVFA